MWTGLIRGFISYSLGREGALELVQGRGVRSGSLAHRRQDLVKRCRHFLNHSFLQRSPNISRLLAY
jgi:hypothetical protein